MNEIVCQALRYYGSFLNYFGWLKMWFMSVTRQMVYCVC